MILTLGAWLTMRGNFTVGMMLAFQGFMSSVPAAGRHLIAAGQSMQEMRT